MEQITGKLLDKKYFIFDIDGTLVDSMEMWNTIDQVAILRASGEFVDTEDVKTIRDSVIYGEDNLGGNIYEAFYAELIALFHLNMTVEEYKDSRRELEKRLSIEEVNFKPGAGEFLQILKMLGKKIGIATTTTKGQIDIYSNQNVKMKKIVSLQKVADALVTCHDVTFKKPHPEAYFKVVELLGANPEECVVFEDSLPGVMAAKEAGLDVVAVFDKSAENEQEFIAQLADYQVESFDEIIKILGLESLQEKINY